jgi:asparagine synthase (glutamine-hydrolysing)
VFGLLGRLYPKADWAPRVFRAKTTFEGMARSSVEAYFHSMCMIRQPLRGRLYSPQFKAELGGYSAQDVFERHARRAGTDDPLALIQYIDTHTYLVGDINTKVDRASMAHSLEVREPLMDHELVEWAATLPSRYKLNGGNGKHFFKAALEPHLPNDVLYRPKMGFSVPLARWIRGPLRQRVRDALLRGPMLEAGWFNPAVVRELVDEHESGRRDHSTPLWNLLMLDAFLRNTMGQASLAQAA